MPLIVTTCLFCCKSKAVCDERTKMCASCAAFQNCPNHQFCQIARIPAWVLDVSFSPQPRPPSRLKKLTTSLAWA